MTLPSRHVTEGMSNALNRIYFHAMGLTREDLTGPLVGVATAWDGAAAVGELPLRVARAAEDGVWAGGATPRQFATVADGGANPRLPTGATVADGKLADRCLHAGLLTRELVADSVELTVRGHSYDALVGVAAAPLALAGLMLAMCRLDIPSVLVPVVSDDPDAVALAEIAEALGLAPPGATEAGATVAGVLAAATDAGRALGGRGTARATVTAEALLAAARQCDPRLAIHLAALAVECGVELSLGELVGSAHWVRGGLAPDGALRTGPATAAAGRARVFDDERAACVRLDAEGWPAGSVLVVRGQGPVGGPAMPVLDLVAAAIARVDTPDDALLVTDGRAPALDGVTCVSAVGPEAAVGGPLATLRDGDAVTLAGGRLDGAPSGRDERATPAGGRLDGAPSGRGGWATPAGRRPDGAPSGRGEGATPADGRPDGCGDAPDGLSPALVKYRRTVRPATTGAATHPGGAGETVRYADL